jgi:hypothetical protein
MFGSFGQTALLKVPDRGCGSCGQRMCDHLNGSSSIRVEWVETRFESLSKSAHSASIASKIVPHTVQSAIHVRPSRSFESFKEDLAAIKLEQSVLSAYLTRLSCFRAGSSASFEKQISVMLASTTSQELIQSECAYGIPFNATAFLS